jgi:hypothetical protein
MKTFKELLRDLDACKEARDWAADKTIEQVIQDCHRGDWMLWLAKKIDIDIRLLTLAKGRCAETVIHLMTDDRSKAAVKAAIDYGNGLISDSELNAAAAAAYAAAYAAYAAAAAAADAADAAYAAYAADAAYAAYAAYAADAAYAAGVAAAADAYADADAADAAYAAAAADDAKTKNQLQTAQICRDLLGHSIIEIVNTKLNTK